MTASFDIDRISSVIFDCDGTLIDSMDAWLQAGAYLISQGQGPLSPEDIEAVRALPIPQAAQILHRYGIGKDPDDVLTLFDEALLDFYRNEACLLPGARELVGTLTTAGVPCVVVSSSPMRYLHAGLSRNNLFDAFVKVISTDEVGISKQESRIYHLAADVMSSDLETTWGVDDALYAIRVMRDAGLHTVGIYSCDETAESFDALAAASDICIRSLDELLQVHTS